MPQITPIVPEGTIQIQAQTGKMYAGTPVPTPDGKSLLAAETPEPKSETAPQQTGSENPDRDKQALKARLFQEREKQRLAAERKKFEAEKRQLEIEKANSRKWQEAHELASQGRYIEAAEKAGITYDQFTQQILNGGQIPPKQIAEQTASQLVDQRFEQFKKEQQENQKKYTETQMNEARKIMFNEVKHFIDNSDKYLLAKESKSYQDVSRFIESEFHRTGRIIPVEEAVKRWEEDALSGLDELLKIESIRQRIQKEPSKPQQPSQTASPERPIPQTISQRTMASVPKPQSLTEAERRQRALDAFYGRLTS